jgi:hypothetical protein
MPCRFQGTPLSPTEMMFSLANTIHRETEVSLSMNFLSGRESLNVISPPNDMACQKRYMC